MCPSAATSPMLPKDHPDVLAQGAIPNPAGPPRQKNPGVSGILTTTTRITIKEMPQDLMTLPIRKEAGTLKVRVPGMMETTVAAETVVAAVAEATGVL